MYDELIRSCRACATGYEGNCDNCMFSGEDCYKQLHKASAEAIEAQDRHILTLQHEMMAEAESHIAEVNRLNKQIEALSKKENTTRWIPVTERLPEKDTRVIVCASLPEGVHSDFIYEDGHWFVSTGVTHWMPLPEPPKEES